MFELGLGRVIRQEMSPKPRGLIPLHSFLFPLPQLCSQRGSRIPGYFLLELRSSTQLVWCTAAQLQIKE